MKRIVTIQDISCVGKCSLTVALPIISAMGIETAVIPTAVLSTHTAFKEFTFRDLTKDIKKISEHWQREHLNFDAVYTGYLGSFEQLNLVTDFINTFKTSENLVIVDPVMGDLGRLYPGFTKTFAHETSKLCGKADIILPNMTEASFMLDIEYRVKYDEAYVKDILKKLCELGTKKAAITGINCKDGLIGVMSLDSETNTYSSYFRKKIDANFHGTGDVFASTLTGSLVKGFSFEKAVEIAVDYTVECIESTVKDPNSRWYGVNFEEKIPYLLSRTV